MVGSVAFSLDVPTVSTVRMLHLSSHFSFFATALACHKLLPSAGLGAVTSIQDAVVLANSIYEMQGITPLDISAALNDYKEERYTRVKAQYDASKMDARLIYGQVRIFSFACVLFVLEEQP